MDPERFTLLDAGGIARPERSRGCARAPRSIPVMAICSRVARTCVAVVLGMVVALGGAAAAWPASNPGSVEGTWRSHRPAGKHFELVLTLVLLPDGTANLYTAAGAGDGLGFPEEGTWRRQEALITVLVFEVGRPPSPNELVLEQRGDQLVPVRWNPEFYGTSTLGPFLKQSEGDSTP